MKAVDFSVNQTTFRILYRKYKEFLIPTGVIFVCLIIIFTILVPQIQSLLAAKDQIVAEQTKLATIQHNILFAQSLNDQTLNQQTATALAALPEDKDFAGVVNALTNAAVASGVSLGDYNFPVGDISATLPTSLTNSSIQLTLQIGGSLTQLERFLTTLKTQLPLSNVTQVQFDNTNNASMTILFYFKPLLKIPFDPTVALTSLSSSQAQILSSFSQINQTTTQF